MATVLVTGAGGVNGTATVRSLLERTDHEIVGVDMDPSAPGCFFADEAAVVPPATDDDWLVEIAEVIDEFNVDVIVPLVDEELPRMSRLEERVPDEVGFVMPTPEVVRTAIDKYALTEELAANDVPTPWTVLASDRDELTSDDFPLVIKPRSGRGSEGFAVLESVADCDRYLAESDYSPDELILQRYLEGTEFTTSVVVTRDNRLLAIVPKEVIEKQGNTIRGVTRRASSIVDSCREVYETLEPHGPLNVQQIIDGNTGVPHVIEVNPRFSSTACLTVAAGVDELDLLIRDAIGRQVTAPDGYLEDLHLLRYTDHLVLSETELEDAGGT